MAGKKRAEASSLSRAQKQRTNRLVCWVTGSEKSPPGGDTAPMMVTDPSAPARVRTRPARS